jgi:hypothetical protein
VIDMAPRLDDENIATARKSCTVLSTVQNSSGLAGAGLKHGMIQCWGDRRQPVQERRAVASTVV